MYTGEGCLVRWFNKRTIAAAFERWRYGESHQRKPMLEIYTAGFQAGVLAEREACYKIVDDKGGRDSGAALEAIEARGYA